MRLRVDNKGEGVELSNLFEGVMLTAGKKVKMAVAERDGTLEYHHTVDGGANWSRWRAVGGKIKK